MYTSQAIEVYSILTGRSSVFHVHRKDAPVSGAPAVSVSPKLRLPPSTNKQKQFVISNDDSIVHKFNVTKMMILNNRLYSNVADHKANSSKNIQSLQTYTLQTTITPVLIFIVLK